MIEKKLTHLHMVIYTWWCWHICKGGGVWALSWEWNTYFPLRRRQEKEAKSWEKHSSDASCGCTGRWLQSHWMRPITSPSFSLEGKLHQHVRRCHTGRQVITVDRPVPTDMARGKSAREHRTWWRVRWWGVGCVRCVFLSSGSLLDRIGRRGVVRPMKCTRASSVNLTERMLGRPLRSGGYSWTESDTWMAREHRTLGCVRCLGTGASSTPKSAATASLALGAINRSGGRPWAGCWAHYSLGGLCGSAREPSNSLMLDSVHRIEWVSDSSAIASWGCIKWH
jgi:hypothetical protein